VDTNPHLEGKASLAIVVRDGPLHRHGAPQRVEWAGKATQGYRVAFARWIVPADLAPDE
jgi:hypothetical protein